MLIACFTLHESNRFQITKLEFVKIDYIPVTKNFLKVCICFNKLDLLWLSDIYNLNGVIKSVFENQVSVYIVLNKYILIKYFVLYLTIFYIILIKI